MMPAQCVSCPFRDDNRAEFQAVLTRLKGAQVSKKNTALAIYFVKQEAALSGEFACHQSAYAPTMKIKPRSEHKQCPGAALYFVKQGEK
jgi:hypothetical protein